MFDVFPDIDMYVSESGIYALYSSKKNLSWCHESLFVYYGKKVSQLTTVSLVQLYNNSYLESIPVPGHSGDSMAFLVNDYYLFKGNTFIMGERVVSKLAGGEKQLAAQSRDYFMRLSQGSFSFRDMEL